MKSRKLIRLLSVALALPVLAVPPLFARGNNDHVMINRLTAESSPAAPELGQSAAADAPAPEPQSQASTDHVFARPYPAGLKMPILRHFPDPQIPNKLRRKRMNGKVIVEVTVDKSGVPSDVHVIKGLEYDFDKIAEDTVLKYRFSPAVYQGRPVAARINIEVNFRIY